MDIFDLLANLVLISCFAAVIPFSLASGVKKKGQISTAGSITVCVFILYALGILAFAGLRFMNENASNQWPTVEGKIESISKRTSFGKHTHYYPVPEVSYTVDGKSYRSKTILFHDDKDGSKYVPGESITVYYQPSQPSNYVLEQGVTFETGFLSILALVTLGGSISAFMLVNRVGSGAPAAWSSRSL